MKKIAIIGKARSGKNTFANLLQMEFKNKYVDSNIYQFAFANPIKRIFSSYFPEADSKYLFGPSELRSNIIHPKYVNDNNIPITYRDGIIAIGEMGRSLNSNFWINKLNEEFNTINFQSLHNLILITDVRRQNEFDYCKSNGYYMVNILRDSQTSNHSTETDQETFRQLSDLVIDNTLPISNLEFQAERLINDL